MNDQVRDFWNDRYKTSKYAYGIFPNQFFKEQLEGIKPSTILLPAEGEGRNAVYAASLGWEVTAFDISSSGREKAMQLAKQMEVSINYEISDVLDFETNGYYDAIGLSYAHLPSEIRKEAYQHLLQFLNIGGIVIFEAFAKSQLGKSSGGPKNLEMLFSIEEIKAEFPQLEFKILKEESIELSEGDYHQGKAEVIRFVGVKK